MYTEIFPKQQSPEAGGAIRSLSTPFLPELMSARPMSKPSITNSAGSILILMHLIAEKSLLRVEEIKFSIKYQDHLIEFCEVIFLKKIKRRILSSCMRSRSDGRVIIASIAIILFFGILSRVLSGSPVYMLRLISIRNSMPRAWVFTLIWTVWYILLGFSFGFILGSKIPGKDIYRFKGSLWFVCMMIFNIVWYPLFFRVGTVFLALVDISIIALFCFLAAVEYFKANRMIGFLMFLHFV
jgi:tryptophan-rich sensory protein